MFIVENYESMQREQLRLYQTLKQLNVSASYLDEENNIKEMHITFNMLSSVHGNDLAIGNDTIQDSLPIPCIVVNKHTLKKLFTDYGRYAALMQTNSIYMNVIANDKNAFMKDVTAFQKKYPYLILKVNDIETSLHKLDLNRYEISYVLGMFSIVAILIVIINLINIISADLLSKKREYATLISLGMKRRQINQILFHNVLRVVLSSLIYGVIIAQLINYTINILFQNQTFYVDWLLISILCVMSAAVSILAVCIVRRAFHDENLVHSIVNERKC